MDYEKVQEAIEAIRRGIAKRIDVDNKVSIYTVGTTIRIDIKE